jgi:hypothetical protein
MPFAVCRILIRVGLLSQPRGDPAKDTYRQSQSHIATDSQSVCLGVEPKYGTFDRRPTDNLYVSFIIPYHSNGQAVIIWPRTGSPGNTATGNFCVYALSQKRDPLSHNGSLSRFHDPDLRRSCHII